MRAALDRQSVIKANAQFWDQMLAMNLEVVLAPQQFPAGSGHLLGSVSLFGAWQGRIDVRMDSGLAYQATAAMMMQPLETVGQADVLDATKEIANMIAGTLKSSLPRPCSMSVPESQADPLDFVNSAFADDSLEVVFSHASGLLLVRVWEQECL